AAISGSFLFIVALTNSIILWRVLKRRQDRKNKSPEELDNYNDAYDQKQDHMFMMRLIGPVITFVNRPWKITGKEGFERTLYSISPYHYFAVFEP
ncbi:hypothetical protein MPER_15555, partial [Moniliophthora perniciosa FA553]